MCVSVFKVLKKLFEMGYQTGQKFQNLNSTSLSLKEFRFYTLKFQGFDFTLSKFRSV